MANRGIPVVPVADDAGVAPGMLIPLSRIEDEYALPDPLPDFRGWKVALPDGRRVGEVSDLIVDTDQMVVKYLEVKVDKDVVSGDDDTYRLVPIAAARLDDNDEAVIVDRLPGTSLGDAPQHTRGAPTREQERAVRSHYEPAIRTAAGAAGGPSDQERFWGRRGAGQGNAQSLARRPRGGVRPDSPAEVVIVEEVVVDGVVVPPADASRPRSGPTGRTGEAEARDR
jgi:sporulation protein YlmC with PRC-barrel domain